MAWITTKDGRKVNTDWFTEEEKKKYRQIEEAQAQAQERNNPQSVVSTKQQEWEEKYRHSENEHIAFFDADGNVLYEDEGSAEEVMLKGDAGDWDKRISLNRNVEQRIWNDEEINSSHNHPLNAIFSPDDIESYEDMEFHCMSITLPNGTTYRLIRRQPRTSNTWRMNEKTGEYEREFEPKKISPAYGEAYDAEFDPGWQKLRQETMWGTPERQKAIEELDKKVRKTMEKWLVQNAANYGYEFVKEKK